jgi:5'-nucleotidase
MRLNRSHTFVRRTVTLALGTAMLAAPVVAVPAQAQEQDFINQLTTPDPSDQDISWIRADVKPDIVTITMRRENVAAFPSFVAEVVLSPAADLYETRPRVELAFSEQDWDSANRVQPNTTPVPLPESARSYRLQDDRIVLTVARSELGWDGPIYFGGLYRANGAIRRIGTSLTSNRQPVGLGPLTAEVGVAGTRTQLSLSAPAMTRGQRTPVRATADVTTDVPGRVDFYDGEDKLAGVPVKDAKASVALPATLALGVHHLKAEFIPADLTKYGASSATGDLTVTAPRVTSVRLATSASSMVQNQPTAVRASAAVSPAGAGRVDFFDGSTRLGAATVAAGRASVNLPRSLRVGAHTIRAVYTPTDQRYASSQATARLTVRAPARATVTAIRLTKTKQTYAKNRAKVRVVVSGKPAGRVVIWDRGRKIKTLVLRNGAATYQLPKRLKRGTHLFKATFTPAYPAQHKPSGSRTVKLIIR